MLWKMAAVVLSLGLDNLLMSAAIGASKVQNKLRLCIVFALFEGLMPAVGFLLGQSLSAWIGQWGFYIGVLGLLGLGIYILFEDDDDDDKVTGMLKGWPLILAALSISLDELAVGFAFGILHFPLWLTLVVLAVQAFAFAYAGLVFGTRLKAYLGEWAEKAAGIVLILTSVILAIEHWFTG
jgi:putative Mn2+ efflux pump MntP